MRRVVITGMGIVSCLGNEAGAVSGPCAKAVRAFASRKPIRK